MVLTPLLKQVGGFQGTPVSSTNKTYSHDITEILLKMALNTINHHPFHCYLQNLIIPL
jgi:hypothetical protein